MSEKPSEKQAKEPKPRYNAGLNYGEGHEYAVDDEPAPPEGFVRLDRDRFDVDRFRKIDDA